MPSRSPLLRLLLLATLALSGLARAGDTYRDLDWLDLLTDKDRDAMLHLPEINHGNGPDSKPKSPLRTNDMNMPAVMYSKAVRPDLDGQKVSLVGFIVPLVTNKQNKIVELFLVPYQGACIHVPPPPPNQIVFLRYPAGISNDDAWSVFRFSGVLHTQRVENDLAESSYAMDVEKVVVNPEE